MKARLSLNLTAVVLLAILVAVGCSRAPTDAQIASDIQNKLSTDSGLQGKQLVVQADKGSVTLSGQVDNDAQRDAAARGAQEGGVRIGSSRVDVFEQPRTLRGGRARLGDLPRRQGLYGR